jgi:hypothetical protein
LPSKTIAWSYPFWTAMSIQLDRAYHEM